MFKTAQRAEGSGSKTTDAETLSLVVRSATGHMKELFGNRIDALQFCVDEHERLLSAVPNFAEKIQLTEYTDLMRMLIDQIVADLKDEEPTPCADPDLSRVAI